MEGTSVVDTALVIGTLAAIASTISFAPQAWKIIKSRRTDGISTGMYSVTVVGFSLWLAYGIMLRQWPLVVPNALCLAISLFILVMTVLPRRKRNEVADLLDPSVNASERGGR